ncbi:MULTISPECIES: LLM class flavin-dependent oxidoreductase [Pseudomonas]|uniref:LLM class flavin-dependent oxidoreductase n=1 Tax=Pseudomonas TaxID=286 RepID=UPI00093102B7|nr:MULTISPECIES: LLM class flavin-dependent oxidoreductase [Pseudomonas]POA89907.1 FMN-dependent monooxygenase [Pseudomonas protegens]PZP09864.1 MAG: FMN-dependent monooxygenase [Pseudomonas protegens]ROM16406.1 nitrilotriacetate monooxygenase [Pseudomonas protegens]
MGLGAFLSGSGAHGGSWRHPQADADASLNFQRYRHYAQTLERGCFDALFLNDNVAVGDLDPRVLARSSYSLRWDPLTLLPALAVVTRHIGLIATASTSYNEPYNLARKFASLDHLSEGRAGWNLVTGLVGGENFNHPEPLSHAERYARAEEFFSVASGLWDSWADDAFPRDKASGQWLRPERMHLLQHRGRHFQVQGPLNAPRPLQGWPVIAQAGSSGPGCELAARCAELVFTAQTDLQQAKAFYRELKERLPAYGRHAGQLKIFPGIAPTVGRTLNEAEEKYQQLQELQDPQAQLKALSYLLDLGIDLSHLPLHAQVPLLDAAPTERHKSRRHLVQELIRRERPSLAQLLRSLSASGHKVLVGTPGQIVDELATWYQEYAADGFNVLFTHLPGAIDDFVQLITPELQRRGLFRQRYTGRSLREHLGLSRVENRFFSHRGNG